MGEEICPICGSSDTEIRDDRFDTDRGTGGGIYLFCNSCKDYVGIGQN